jgi:quinol monooxygenase YgiN
MTHAVINRLAAKPGRRDDVVGILLESGRAFDGNDDCLLYLVTEAADDPDVIYVVDLWTDEASHAEALQAAAIQDRVGEAMEMLEGKPEQIEVRVRGGKGVSES